MPTPVDEPLVSEETSNQFTESLPVSDEVVNKEVKILVFDPVLSDSRKTVSQYYGWNDSLDLAVEAMNWIRDTTGGRVVYNIVDEIEREDGEKAFLEKEDGFLYNEDSLVRCLDSLYPEPRNCHEPDEVNYKAIIDEYNLCEDFNQGKFDEVWMFGYPYAGFYESRLAGNGAFWYNSPPLEGTSCNGLMPIMGFNYERDLPEMVESISHRAESTMEHVYGGWEQNRQAHNWDKFGLNKALSPDFSYSGCGSVHYPPNGVDDYDYTNRDFVDSTCTSFSLNYPNTENLPTEKINCQAWDCTQEGYFRWWYRNMPRYEGVGPDGKLNDWWSYIFDVNQLSE